jgi:transcriptional regulator with XRE-family HTH domain
VSTERDDEGRIYPTRGLRACRLAAGLTQRELADAVGSHQTFIAELEDWRNVKSYMFEKLCRVLKVAPKDLTSPHKVEDAALQEGQQQVESASEKEKIERRRQVNRIKRRRYYVGSGAVLLRGLRNCRTSAGLTQRQLAAMIGTNQATIAQLEKGTYRGAYMRTVKKLCRALGVSPADLICSGSVE